MTESIQADQAEQIIAHQNDGFTRRQFALMLAGGAAAATFGGLLGCTPREEVPDTVANTYSCDVLVIGGGGAGVTAASQAASFGAKTILIEKMDSLKGSSALALGTFYGAGTKLQEAAGITDTPAALLDYFLSRGGDKLDFDVQAFCADHFGETIDWLSQDLGVPFVESVSLKGKDTVPRGHNVTVNARQALDAVADLATKNGVEFHYETAAESFVLDESGAIEGVLTTYHTGETFLYEAKKVIMATGGFCRNQDMIAEYCPDYVDVYTEVGTGCTGEGLQMGLDLGADYLGHGGTNGILACAVSAGQSKLISNKALWIDSSGTRFANEGGQTHDIYYEVAHFADQAFYAIYDQRMVDELDEDLKASFDLGINRGIFTQGATLAEAAGALGIDGAAAEQALASYNALVASGADTQFNKKSALLVPITTAPFYVLTLGICTHGSFGGYRVNTDFQVLDTNSNPLPNLYAVGEVSCGTFIYDDYPAGGCGLNWSYTSGRYAGKNAAEAIK